MKIKKKRLVDNNKISFTFNIINFRKMKKQVFIIDDHELFSRSLEMMINSFDDYTVVFCGQSGKDLIFRLQDSLKPAPDIILLDLNMPVMNGLETMDWISVNRPELNVLVLSMQDNDDLVLKMIRKGVKGYLLKDISPQILLKALDDTLNYGFSLWKSDTGSSKFASLRQNVNC